MLDPETKKIFKKNQELLEDLEKRVKKIQSQMMWNTVWGALKVLFIIGPIIFGIIYLSPYVSNYFKAFRPVLQALQLAPYKEALENKDGTTGDQTNQQVIDALCDEEVRNSMIDQYCPKQ